MSARAWRLLSRAAAAGAAAAGMAGVLLPDPAAYLAAWALVVTWALAGIIATGLDRQAPTTGG